MVSSEDGAAAFLLAARELFPFVISRQTAHERAPPALCSFLINSEQPRVTMYCVVNNSRADRLLPLRSLEPSQPPASVARSCCETGLPRHVL